MAGLATIIYVQNEFSSFNSNLTVSTVDNSCQQSSTLVVLNQLLGEAPVEDGKARVVIKITGVLVDLLVNIAPEIYGPHVVYENGHKVLYVQVVRALYGMLVAALLW